MMAVFADTFYWIALTHPSEHYHRPALDFDARFERSGRVLTSEEVLTEYLNFFSTQGAYWRARAIAVVQGLRRKTYLHILPQTSVGFTRGFELYVAGRTSATVSPTASRCRSCAAKESRTC